jgi:hypothetical protein
VQRAGSGSCSGGARAGCMCSVLLLHVDEDKIWSRPHPPHCPLSWPLVFRSWCSALVLLLFLLRFSFSFPVLRTMC